MNFILRVKLIHAGAKLPLERSQNDTIVIPFVHSVIATEAPNDKGQPSQEGVT